MCVWVCVWLDPLDWDPDPQAAAAALHKSAGGLVGLQKPQVYFLSSFVFRRPLGERTGFFCALVSASGVGGWRGSSSQKSPAIITAVIDHYGFLRRQSAR